MKAKVEFRPPGLSDPIIFVGTVQGESRIKPDHWRISDDAVVYEVPLGQFEIMRDEIDE